MTPFEISTLLISVVGIILLPVLAIMIRGAVKWTHTEDRLSTLIDDVRELIDSKEKVHSEMYAQMRIDRDATDRRLRFIEEWFMRGQPRGRG